VSSHDTDVLIAGGGIGGLAVALAIGRTGRRVRLTERAAQFGEIGAGLQLGPNAARMMDRLGILDAVLKSAVLPKRGLIFSAVTGELLTALDFGEAFVERYGYPYIVAHRRDLLDALLERCRKEPTIELLNGYALSAVQVDEANVIAEFHNGQTITADMIVGADGIKSVVRALIDDETPVPSGHVAYRGTVPTATVADFVDREDIALWIGPGLHLMQYPIRSGELYNQVAVIESDRFARGEDDWGNRDELEEKFAGMCPAVRRSVSFIEPDRGTLISDREPSATWSHGRAVLMGDAAHAMLQYLGQGACQALEDAVVLAEELEHSPDDHAAAFARYETRRIPRATRCQQVARPWGELWHVADPVSTAIRNKYFRLRETDDYSELDWLYRDSESMTTTKGHSHEIGKFHHA
jgi:2-polyprenyl-6-methoxyphenol hydroxylase-like FAD-dependent oxidoreductase